MSSIFHFTLVIALRAVAYENIRMDFFFPIAFLQTIP